MVNQRNHNEDFVSTEPPSDGISDSSPASSDVDSRELKKPLKKKPIHKRKSVWYFVFHFILSIVAIWLAYKYNSGFKVVPTLVAFCCPHAYLSCVVFSKVGVKTGLNINLPKE